MAVLWPGSGLALGSLVILGRGARPSLVIGVVVGTVAANLMSDRSVLTMQRRPFWPPGCSSVGSASRAGLGTFIGLRAFSPPSFPHRQPPPAEVLRS